MYSSYLPHTIGKMTESSEYIAPCTPDMLEDVKVITFESAQHYFLAVSDNGQVYSWGENSGGTCQVRCIYKYIYVAKYVTPIIQWLIKSVSNDFKFIGSIEL